MTDRELMQQALEALAEWKEVFPDNWDAFDEQVFTALRERLAQPEQEPVVIHQFRSPHCSDWYDGVPDHHDGYGPYEVRTLYTSPPTLSPAQRKPLTDEEIIKCWGQVGGTRYGYVAFARAIEAVHGIKENT